MLVKFHCGGGYQSFCGIGIIVGSVGGKNNLYNHFPLLLLSMASWVTHFVTRSLLASMGILDLLASDAGVIIILLACQMLDSSSPSNHSTQCSALVLCISLVHWLHCCQYSSHKK